VTDATRPGRRPGTSTTRDAIADAAGRQFAELGYDRTTIRGIAREAGVDPALVVHFFGSKQRLFADVVELPFDAAEVLPRLLEGDRADIGRRFATFVVGVLESGGREAMVGLVRAAASEPAAAEAVRELVTRRVIGTIVDAIGSDDAPLRASLVGAQVVGLVMARHVVGVEPLASTDPQSLIEAIAPTFQRLLTEPLGS